MSNFKKLICLVLVLVMGLVMVTGCGKNDEVGSLTPKDSIDAIDFGDGIIAKGKKLEISADTYGYYVYQCALTTAMKEDPNLTDIANFDWSKTDDTGVKVADVIKKNAANALIKRMVLVDHVKKNGIKFEDEERNQIKSSMEAYEKQQGAEMFAATLNSIGVSSVDAYMELYESETLYNKFKEDFDKNRDNYIKNDKKMTKYKDDENVSVKHILIMNDSTKHEDPRAAADEILSRLKNGEDFDELMKEYNEDPGEPASGYSFGHGEMVPEFEEASFALDYDEISEVVESSYGYHIIKRVVGRGEYENYIVDEANMVKNTEYINSLSLAEILTKISDANKFLAEAQKGEQ